MLLAGQKNKRGGKTIKIKVQALWIIRTSLSSSNISFCVCFSTLLQQVLGLVLVFCGFLQRNGWGLAQLGAFRLFRSSFRLLWVLVGCEAAHSASAGPMWSYRAWHRVAVAARTLPPRPWTVPLLVEAPRRCQSSGSTFCSTIWGLRGYSSLTRSEETIDTEIKTEGRDLSQIHIYPLHTSTLQALPLRQKMLIYQFNFIFFFKFYI